MARYELPYQTAPGPVVGISADQDILRSFSQRIRLSQPCIGFSMYTSMLLYCEGDLFGSAELQAETVGIDSQRIAAYHRRWQTDCPKARYSTMAATGIFKSIRPSNAGALRLPPHPQRSQALLSKGANPMYLKRNTTYAAARHDSTREAQHGSCSETHHLGRTNDGNVYQLCLHGTGTIRATTSLIRPSLRVSAPSTAEYYSLAMLRRRPPGSYNHVPFRPATFGAISVTDHWLGIVGA